MKTILLFLFCFLFVANFPNNASVATRVQNDEPQLPVIDKTKKYPKKTIVLEDIADVSYIPLETTRDVLLDKDYHLYYFSENRIVVTNYRRGDVFVFDGKGKVVSWFNYKGGDGYAMLNCLAYDEKNKEIFIGDYIYNLKILVYTEAGVLKRILRLSPVTWVKKLYNFDEHTLFAVHDNKDGRVSREQPYMFLSKKNGSIISHLDISVSKVHPNDLIISKSETNVRVFTTSTSGDNYKFGQEFIIADKSLDTVYLLKRDKTLTPLFTQQPSVFSESPKYVSVAMKTDRFIQMDINSWDLQKIYEKKQDIIIAELIYDFRTGEIFEYDGSIGVHNIDIPSNISVRLIPAENLINAYKNNLLTGETKRMASRLHEEDNPVLKLIRFK